MPINKALLSLLVDPITRGPLEFDVEHDSLVVTGDKNNTFSLDDGIPVLVKKSDRESGIDKSVHDSNYIDHYETDGAEFNYFDEWDDPASIHENDRLREMILSNVRGHVDKVLDVGCGSGWVAKHFRSSDVTLVSFDLSIDNLRGVRERYPSNSHFQVKGDVLNLPFLDNSFDCVISAEVMEHVVNTKGYIENIIRVLKPGGVAIISTPYDEKIQYSLCIHCNQKTPLHAHIHSFKEDSLDDVVESFKEVKLNTLTFLNKGLVFFRTHWVLKLFPFEIWRAIDYVANKLWFKPLRIVFLLKKEN